MKTRYRIILLSLVVIILIGAISIGMYFYQNWNTQKKIKEYQTNIESVAKTFSDSTERADKLEILKNLINEANKYNDLENSIKEVKQKYKQEIQSMTSCFIEMYDTEIAQNTLSDIGTITDKETLNNAKNNLSLLLDTIENEHELTLSEAEHTEYVAKINSLVEGYTNRVAEIEKAEEEARLKAEEARLKAEAEAKAKAEQEAKEKANKQNNSASSNASDNKSDSNKNTSSNNTKFNFDPNDDSKLPAGWTHYWETNPDTGVKVEGSDTWTDPNGNCYGLNGKFLFNIYEIGF